MGWIRRVSRQLAMVGCWQAELPQTSSVVQCPACWRVHPPLVVFRYSSRRRARQAHGMHSRAPQLLRWQYPCCLLLLAELPSHQITPLVSAPQTCTCPAHGSPALALRLENAYKRQSREGQSIARTGPATLTTAITAAPVLVAQQLGDAATRRAGGL